VQRLEDLDKPTGSSTTSTGSGVRAAGASSIPESIGEYRILRLIGEGGMGVVYEAEQQAPRRIVA
jgi:hypothetical protein